MGEREKSESYRREKDYPSNRGRKEREQSWQPTPVAGSSTEVQYTRRVKPKYDFLHEGRGSDEAFDDLRQTDQVRHHSIRRVKEVLDRKEVTEAIHDMFNNDLEELITFFKENVREEKKEKEEEKVEEKKKLQERINRIRCVSVSSVNKRRSSPMMMGRILGRSNNKKELFVADTGTSVIIPPINIAKHIGVIWTYVDTD